MAINAASRGSSFDRYIEEIRAVWGDGQDPDLPFKVKASMERLLASTSPDEPWMAEILREGKAARELYRDPDHGFIQMAHVQKHGLVLPPHDHGPCWVVYGDYQGVTNIPLYERTDDGSEAGVAKLAQKELHRLGPGVVHPYLVGDIHSTHTAEGPAVVFRFLSYDLTKVQRNRFNLDNDTVSFA